MFYSLREVAKKLNKTEEEVKELIKNGRLREFRDGPTLLFKVDEVEALMADTSIIASQETAAPPEQKTEQEEISLVPEPDETALEPGALSDADTIMANEGTDILMETDSLPETGSGEQLTDDLMGETKVTPDETSLEEIEEDINLDTFGSGSGLLDLSLQADDTSLGGILDEIYTPEGEADQESPASGTAMDVAAETEQMLAEEVFAAPVAPGAAAVPAYVEPEPDTLSNAFGYMLFLPLLAIIYTAIVVAAGFKNVMPSILEQIQGIIWYIIAGIAGAAILIVVVAFMLTSSPAKGIKKPKAEKAKRVKKAKKGDKAEETLPPLPDESQSD